MGMQLPGETKEPRVYPDDLPELKTTFKAIFKRRGKNFQAKSM